MQQIHVQNKTTLLNAKHLPIAHFVRTLLFNTVYITYDLNESLHELNHDSTNITHNKGTKQKYFREHLNETNIP